MDQLMSELIKSDGSFKHLEELERLESNRRFNEMQFHFRSAHSFSKMNYQQCMRNLTTLIDNTKYQVGIQSYMGLEKNRQYRMKFTPFLSIPFTDDKSFLKFNFQQYYYGDSSKSKSKLKLSTCYYVSPSWYVMYKLNLNTNLTSDSCGFAVGNSQFQFKIRKNQSLQLVYNPGNKVRPYIQTDLAKNTIAGLDVQLKSYTFYLKKKWNSSSFQTGMLLNVVDGWRIGFELVLGNRQILFSIILGRHTTNIQLPVHLERADDDGHKFTLYGMAILFGMTILKCFQRPKELQNADSVEDRLEQQRGFLRLMDKRVQDSYKHEKATKGLLILEAYYGKSEDVQLLLNQANRHRFLLQSQLQLIDVTFACQFYVKNRRLVLPGYSKGKLRGFCDPCQDEKSERRLVILYQLGESRAQKEFRDEEPVLIE